MPFILVASFLLRWSCELVARYAPKSSTIFLRIYLNGETRQVIRRAINDSFVFGFRWVTVIGAALVAASAGTALFWIGGTQTARSSLKTAGR